MDRFTNNTPIANELVTGPIATNTFENEVLGVAGAIGLFAVNQVLNLDQIDCRHLNKNSYALVNVSDSAGTATLTSKDENGATVLAQTNGVTPCTATYGP